MELSALGSGKTNTNLPNTNPTDDYVFTFPLTIRGGPANIPSVVNSGIIIEGSATPTVAGRIYFGNGTGLFIDLCARSGGVTNDVVKIRDDGAIFLDSLSYQKFKNPLGRTISDVGGAGVTISGDADINPLTTDMFLPSKGSAVRTGMTVARTDTLPTGAAVIAAVAAEMPGGVWDIGHNYVMWWGNAQATALQWTITRPADSTIFFANGGTTTMNISGNSGMCNRKLVTITRVSETHVSVYEI